MRLDGLPAYIPAWKSKVAQLHKTFSSKPMTSSILKYMFNQYFLPSVVYRTYGNALDERAFDKHILSPLLPAIKHRLKLPSTAPNHLLFHSEAYVLKHPFQRTFTMHMRHVMCLLSLDHPASLLFKHHCRLLQLTYDVSEFPLAFAVEIDQRNSSDYVLSLNRIFAKYRLTIHPHPSVCSFHDTSFTHISPLYLLPVANCIASAKAACKCTTDDLLHFDHTVPATPTRHSYGTC